MAFQDKPEPNDPGDQALTLLKKKYERACDKWVKVEEEVEKNNKMAYTLILKHCDPSMKINLESTANFQ